ncbi:MAG: DUF4244 domain-containing protein [Leucobacter sp.]
MKTTLHLVTDHSAEGQNPSAAEDGRLSFQTPERGRGASRRRHRDRLGLPASIRRVLEDERGAVTAEYAIVIMAAVARLWHI